MKRKFVLTVIGFVLLNLVFNFGEVHASTVPDGYSIRRNFTLPAYSSKEITVYVEASESYYPEIRVTTRGDGYGGDRLTRQLFKDNQLCFIEHLQEYVYHTSFDSYSTVKQPFLYKVKNSSNFWKEIQVTEMIDIIYHAR